VISVLSHSRVDRSSLLLFSHGGSFQFDSVCIVYEPVDMAQEKAKEIADGLDQAN